MAVSAEQPTFQELYEKLTGLEQRFVDNLLADPTNLTEALRKAGSKARRMDAAAWDMKNRPRVKAALEAARREAAEQAAITAKDVLQGLHREATYFGRGSSHAARVQAWTQLGKHFGLFPTKIEGDLRHTHTFEEALEEVLDDDGDGGGDDSLGELLPDDETETVEP